MAELFGQASWTGCNDSISCSYTYGHGTAPGVATLVLDEFNARSAATYGDLILTDGTNVLPLRDCKVSDIQYQGRGRYSFSILDRRWKWAFGGIDGVYNQRDHKNQVIQWQKQSLEHLVRICFLAMKEPVFNIGDLPGVVDDADLPAVDWSWVNPAQALSELVEAYGCRVVWRPFENDVVIRKVGVGADLPDLDYESFTPTIDLPERPSRLAVVGAETAYTCAFALEAVGMEPWGEIKPINQLSYTPAAGWAVSPPPYFDNLTVPDLNPALGIFYPGIKVSTLTRKEYIALAQSCVFKMYRITLVPLFGPKFSQPGLENVDFPTLERPPGGGAMTTVEAQRYFKLLEGIITTRRDELGQMVVDPPRVHGVYNRGAANYWTNTEKQEAVTEGFRIDAERGLVIFNRYMFRLNPTAAAVAAQIAVSVIGGKVLNDAIQPSKVSAAELVLVCSCSVRDIVNHQFDRVQRLREIGPLNLTKERIIHKEDIRLVKYAEFDPMTWQVKVRADNVGEVDKAANFYLDGTEKEYEVIGTATRKYPGILLTQADGALQQFTYEVGGGSAPTTTISRNSEHATWLPSYKQLKGGRSMKVIVDLATVNTGWGRLLSGATKKPTP